MVLDGEGKVAGLAYQPASLAALPAAQVTRFDQGSNRLRVAGRAAILFFCVFYVLIQIVQFEPDDAERRVVELDVLLVVVMRRVVGGDDVDGAVGKPASSASRSAPRAAAGSSWRWCRSASTASSVSTKWCGATSQVTRRPRPCPRGPRRATAAALMCARWTGRR